MTFTKISHSLSDPGGRRQAPERPPFNSSITADRLRESSKLPPLPMGSSVRKGRKSIFREIGLDEEDEGSGRCNPSSSLDDREFADITGIGSQPAPPADRRSSVEDEASKGRTRWLSKLAPTKRSMLRPSATAPPPAITSLSRFTMIVMFIAVVLPAISFNNGRQKVEMNGADAGVIRGVPNRVIQSRDDSPTDVCLRWAGQSAIVNGTVYYYGGRSKSSGDQTSDQWNNDFLTLDLTKSWDIGSPALTGLPRPSGPPAVSLGYLWNDLDHLWLYGGEFSDTPAVEPSPVSTWMYDIGSSSWEEFQNPKTSAGNYSEPAGQPIQRAAEGAGVSVPELGLSWYFGGHLDWATTPGWSNQVPRVYLDSLLEFTTPGYANSGVNSLHASGAPEGGAYRNITQGGIQNSGGFTERADGVLVYVPGWGPNGILLGLGGGVVGDDGTTDAFASMTTIDVYDIESSEWYHQVTTGDAPQVRVNPCAVVFSAPDASSFNIYMYGGQNLIPYEEQTQYTDVWILTIPSFTWVKADLSSSDEPPARAGHQCAARDGQMVVVGGYINDNTSCEDTGVYNFDASKLAWKSSFDAADHPADDNADNSVLAGSYGYRVPDPVQSVIGGSSDGGATATTPADGPATGGPFKTGTAPVFTVTATPAGGGPGSSTDPATRGASKGGLIAAGVVAGLAGLAAIYLGFCAWLWRRQVRAYRKHMAVANRYSADPKGSGPGSGEAPNAATDGADAALLGSAGLSAACATTHAAGAVKDKFHRKGRRGSSSQGTGGGGSREGEKDRGAEQFGWVGQLGEPRWMTDGSTAEPSPGSGSGTGTGTGTGSSTVPRPSEDRNPWGYDYLSAAKAVGATGPSPGGVDRQKSSATRSTASGGSAEALMDGREPNFFSVVLGPRRALRVVNGMEDREGGE
ncbi:hypothetical protein F4780DRAFT_37919 [Xylariomycetidae sp. FL0641]|nr:hypothetical protein F4780DRAFT_37919 [Xylariomycetidae sp. FL0641]